MEIAERLVLEASPLKKLFEFETGGHGERRDDLPLKKLFEVYYDASPKVEEKLLQESPALQVADDGELPLEKLFEVESGGIGCGSEWSDATPNLEGKQLPDSPEPYDSDEDELPLEKLFEVESDGIGYGYQWSDATPDLEGNQLPESPEPHDSDEDELQLQKFFEVESDGIGYAYESSDATPDLEEKQLPELPNRQDADEDDGDEECEGDEESSEEERPILKHRVKEVIDLESGEFRVFEYFKADPDTGLSPEEEMDFMDDYLYDLSLYEVRVNIPASGVVAVDLYDFRMANKALKFVLKQINCKKVSKYVDEPVEAGVLLNATYAGFIYFITFEAIKRSRPTDPETGTTYQAQAQVLLGIGDEEPELLHFRINPRTMDPDKYAPIRIKVQAECSDDDAELHSGGSGGHYDEPWLDWPVLNESDPVNEFPNEKSRLMHYRFFREIRDNMGYEIGGRCYATHVVGVGGLITVDLYRNGMADEAFKFTIEQLNHGKLSKIFDEEVDACELLQANATWHTFYITFTVTKKSGRTETCQAQVEIGVGGSSHRLHHFRIKPATKNA